MQVGIVMGSKSDEPLMASAAKTLTELGISFEVNVISAHRAPAAVAEYAGNASGRGIKVLIAGAGMSAHLAGALAANSILPVIGVPIASGKLSGMDSLLSTVQMPSGVPVATVAIDGAKNAAILAAEILALHDTELAKRLLRLREDAAKASKS